MTAPLPHTQPAMPGQEHNIMLRVFAQFFSVLFHPLFIPTYVVAFLLNFHPSYFSGFNNSAKMMLLLTTALNTAFFPAFSVFIMKGLGFIKSVFLHSQQDRIGPYLASMIFYFWAARVFFKFEPQLSPVLPAFMTGVFLTTVAALIINIFYKISMHAIGCGGLLGIFLIIMNSNSMLMTWPLSLALLVTGIVCTSRFIVSNHTPKEIYAGLLVGLLCQLIAAFVIL
ncbi:MAG: hypothetical protein KTQ13_03345 [Ferruginibacter sp.]|nr:hypothetical protein [Chitinophagaceae bacterium]MBP6285659.1 hypothetical protein [Ferruginibacter sp.]MBU9935662.1 hypothetical protein [Ferruginibacter sp.]HQY10970.1 hypothetical protein [Ferruginibacter sp.]